jgi:hypothetical protein
MDDLYHTTAQVAERLCLAQSELAGESVETRNEHYDRIIAEALSAVSESERDAFLDVLEKRFAVSPLSAAEPVAESPTVADLAAAWRACSPAQRRELRALLDDEAPADSAPRTAAPSAADPALLRSLNVSRLDPTRALQLTEDLAACAGALEPAAWNAWRALAPRSELRRDGDLTALMRRWVEGDAEVSREDIQQALNDLRKLLAALNAALGHLTHQLAHEVFARIAPTEIENLIGMESGGFLTSREVRCWRKYVEVAENFTEIRMEQDIKGRVARYVESLMNVAGR